MRNSWAIPLGVVCGLLGAALLLLVTSQPRGEPIQLLPPPTVPPLAVHVTGAVVQPGVFLLPVGSRVTDAIQAAGGMLAEADPESLNLAAFVEDGERVWVPWKPAIASPTQSLPGEEQTPQRLPPQPTQQDPSLPVNINTATQIELESLPGIGSIIAARIIAYRQEHGLFTKLDDLLQVEGIGPTKFEKLKDLITLGYSP